MKPWAASRSSLGIDSNAMPSGQEIAGAAGDLHQVGVPDHGPEALVVGIFEHAVLHRLMPGDGPVRPQLGEYLLGPGRSPTRTPPMTGRRVIGAFGAGEGCCRHRSLLGAVFLRASDRNLKLSSGCDSHFLVSSQLDCMACLSSTSAQKPGPSGAPGCAMWPSTRPARSFWSGLVGGPHGRDRDDHRHQPTEPACRVRHQGRSGQCPRHAGDGGVLRRCRRSVG